MRKKLLALGAIVTLVALPFVVAGAYRALTAFPARIRIASGPEGGRYRVLALELKEAIEAELGVSVEVLTTEGSLENARLLCDGQADLAFYQRSAQRMGRTKDLPNPDLARAELADDRQVRCVANLYSEVCHLIVRRGAGIAGPDDLRGKRMALPSRNSGDYVIASLLMDEFGLQPGSYTPIELTYPAIRQAFAEETIDAALITMGVEAPICQELLSSGRCQLIGVPRGEVLTRKHLALSPYTIPQGFYRLSAPLEPAADVPTVALRAQLLARADLSAGFVEELTRLLLREDFLQANHLAELAQGGNDFARAKLEFPLHRGATNYYEPELRPILNPDFVEATEGLRSLVVSVAIAGFLAIRWLVQRRARRKEHKLDRFIRQLLELEQQQIALDQSEGWCDLEKLQALLDQVTALRHEALREFSAHELNEDRAADCLLELCQALTEKINAKISRQRLDKRFAELGAAVRQATGPAGV
jgi:TRAP transporter TAXI family solute receptor